MCKVWDSPSGLFEVDATKALGIPRDHLSFLLMERVMETKERSAHAGFFLCSISEHPAGCYSVCQDLKP